MLGNTSTCIEWSSWRERSSSTVRSAGSIIGIDWRSSCTSLDIIRRTRHSTPSGLREWVPVAQSWFSGRSRLILVCLRCGLHDPTSECQTSVHWESIESEPSVSLCPLSSHLHLGGWIRSSSIVSSSEPIESPSMPTLFIRIEFSSVYSEYFQRNELIVDLLFHLESTHVTAYETGSTLLVASGHEEFESYPFVVVESPFLSSFMSTGLCSYLQYLSRVSRQISSSSLSILQPMCIDWFLSRSQTYQSNCSSKVRWWWKSSLVE